MIKFHEEIKFARATSWFKPGNKETFGNYRPVSVLSYFSKLLEQIMYEKLYKYLAENNEFYKKYFCFSSGKWD